MTSVYFYEIQTHNFTRVSSFHAAAPVQSTGETGGRCGRCGRHQVPPFLRQSELVQIGAVGFCGSAATTRATSSETGRPGWSPVSDWTHYSISQLVVIIHVFAHIFHFHPVPFFLYEISQEAVFYPFMWIAHFIISLRVYSAFFVCAGNTQQQLCGAIIIINNNLNTKWPHRWRSALTLLLTRTWYWSRSDTTLMFSQQPSSEACFFFFQTDIILGRLFYKP